MRTPLGLINRNITRGKELTPKLRNKICALVENGHDIPFIIGCYKISRGVVRYTSTTKPHALKLTSLGSKVCALQGITTTITQLIRCSPPTTLY
jgi:hypothetical protein